MQNPKDAASAANVAQGAPAAPLFPSTEPAEKADSGVPTATADAAQPGHPIASNPALAGALQSGTVATPVPAVAQHHVAYCQERSTPEGSSLYYASLFVPSGLRDGWLGVLTLVRDIQSVPLKVEDSHLAAIKLAWWKTEMERALAGQAGHPATRCMSPELARSIGLASVSKLVQAVSITAQWPRHFTQAEWDSCCQDWGGEAFLMGARALGVTPTGAGPDATREDDATANSIRQWGAAAMRLTQLLMLAPAISQGWHPIPVDVLQTSAISAEALRRRDGGPALQALLHTLHRRTVAEGETAWRALPRTVRLRLRPLRALWRMRVAEMQLAEQAGYPLLTERIRITPLKKLWLAWSSHALRR